ncbi:putative reverse transcriptase domain-containing protein, partial [Tanacetum coccineum]
MDEAHTMKYSIHLGANKMYHDLRDMYCWPEIPEWKWDRITMDFITKLPRSSSGHDTIWVIVDRLTKSAHLLAIREDYKMERLARLYIDEIVARHRVHVLVISDRDGRFTSRLNAVRYRQKSYADNRRKPLEFELSSVHDTFHVSTLKKCLADANLHVPLEEIKVDKTLCFVEEPVEIMDPKVKKLKR